MKTKKIAFTLAEVLIVLGLIGVVAALSLPSLIYNINSKINAHKMDVIEKKLLQGINLLNSQDNGLSVPYNSTKDFVTALSKHMKIVTICGPDELTNCFPYNEMTYERSNGTETVDLTKLDSPSKLNIYGAGFKDLAGFVTADGIPFVISYNTECAIAEPDQVFKGIPECVAGLYDLNGSNSPNKFGYSVVDNKDVFNSDIIGLNGARLSKCIYENGDLCLASKISTATLNFEDAKNACAQIGGHIPNADEYDLISMEMYGCHIKSGIIGRLNETFNDGVGGCSTSNPDKYSDKRAKIGYYKDSHAWVDEGADGQHIMIHIFGKGNSVYLGFQKADASLWNYICISD